MLLTERLKEYAGSDATAMHMPGHKRNADAYPWLAERAIALDITEIEGFDDLNAPRGIFAELEARAAGIWGADESVCLVNGSTGGVLAAVWASLERGGALLMARASHRSVYNAAHIAGVETYYIAPETDAESGVLASVRAESVKAALDAHPDVRAAVITSPTYEGVVSDVRAIADVCHERGVLLIVDSAHGAHLGLDGFPESAVERGADITIASLHKTLPSLTQTAILHIKSKIIGARDVRRAVSMFQTSSPSYVLTSSIDGCIRYIESEGSAAASRWLRALRAFRESAAGLSNLRLLERSDAFYALDPSKIVILTSGTDMSGARLSHVLREKFHIETEMACADYVLAMTGMGDTDETLSRLASAIRKADRMCAQMENGEGKKKIVCAYPMTERRLSVREASAMADAGAGEFVDFADAVGRISGEYVYAYPPGIPMIVPGEVVDESVTRAVENGVNVRFSKGGAPGRIFCLC